MIVFWCYQGSTRAAISELQELALRLLQYAASFMSCALPLCASKSGVLSQKGRKQGVINVLGKTGEIND
ncbi:hypothetical protein D1605_004210 [Xylella fastidiosa subsp. fastidiosa]|uniref:Uncharacterized protein n=2 Tax=Xylella fastidiosa TaxID=2371 RepID=Q87DA7_XYLFT|nr:conserved hypothetical protein [Xylella fastidiosa Temecula1]ACB92261.1 hypothetical protein XfasM23_0823 [Xylella fastidiosa M23]MBE0262927.1 hypothetical protein [Xylella fastidiosa subsp. fastidiosa]NMR00211.1 hypothetical protein [Xylella fastidiosa]MBE0265130.1 hypothetical protein [Xylella fastidiosa subsp. fastidiosa]